MGPRLLFPSMRGYKASELRPDVVAGLTLVAIAVPEQMATARLAQMPAVAGLYAFLAGSVLFALLGRSRHLSVGADFDDRADLCGGRRLDRGRRQPPVRAPRVAAGLAGGGARRRGGSPAARMDLGLPVHAGDPGGPRRDRRRHRCPSASGRARLARRGHFDDRSAATRGRPDRSGERVGGRHRGRHAGGDRGGRAHRSPCSWRAHWPVGGHRVGQRGGAHVARRRRPRVDPGRPAASWCPVGILVRPPSPTRPGTDRGLRLRRPDGRHRASVDDRRGQRGGFRARPRGARRRQPAGGHQRVVRGRRQPTAAPKS